jgi:hypothetical protein
MASAKTVMGVAIALAIAATFVGPIVSAVNSNSGAVDVTNETVTADIGNAVDLDGYNIDNSTVTVYEYNDSAGAYETATAGADYEMGLGNGSIVALGTSDNIQDGEDVKVTYTYQATSGASTTVLGLIPLFLALLILGVLAERVQDMM